MLKNPLLHYVLMNKMVQTEFFNKIITLRPIKFSKAICLEFTHIRSTFFIVNYLFIAFYRFYPIYHLTLVVNNLRKC